MKLITGAYVSLEILLEQGAFREDLYKKISTVILQAPPLRERAEDILPLAYYAIRTELGLDADMISIESAAQHVLEQYAWPGNQTELEDVMLSALKSAKGKTISKDCLPAEMIAAVKKAPKAAQKQPAGSVHRWAFLRAYLNSVEKDYIRSVYRMMGGDNLKTAKALKISVAELLKKLAQ